MYLLDTDTASNTLARNRHFDDLQARILTTPPERIFISIVTVEEQCRGALARISAARKGNLIVPYALFQSLLADISRFQLLPYDEAAAAAFEQIPTPIRRRHPQDCRIAAIALVNGCTVVTRNRRDFEQVPGLDVEDWT